VAGLDLLVSTARWLVHALSAERDGSSADLAISGYKTCLTIGLRGPYGTAGADRWVGAWDARKWISQAQRAEMYPPKTYLDDAIDFDHRITSGDGLRVTTDGRVRAIDLGLEPEPDPDP